YMVGSRHEAYGETGMAHLLEHLVFKGTPDHPDIPKELNEHGARFNGTTWYDRTNYFETVPATDENLQWALEMESDRMINSYISADDLESEMTVVRNEFEMGENSPTGVLLERVLSTAYLWHNYGKSTIGARADIENVPIERLQGFYRKYYQPDNAYLIIAGKFEPAKTMNLVMETFGKIPKPERELIPTYTREPVQDGERYANLARVGDVQAVSAAYHICPGSHQDYPAVDVLVDLMTSEPAGRLYKTMVESGKASSQWGWAAQLAEPGFAYFHVDVPKDKDRAEAKATMLATLDDLAENPPTAEEVERAKTSLLKDFNLAYRESGRVGTLISE
ncbi:MAG: pitrilysin family protein, partial [Bacteroidota bacterium]